ncbi:MAG: outer membrane protein assembly factor, partial [Burkholderiaceae bacterium]
MRALRCALRLSLALGVAGLLGACAALRPGRPDSPPPPPPQVLLTVDAPAPQRQLLEANLDLARLSIVAPGEAISDAELRRLEVAAPAQVRALLATQGYMDPEVTLSREPSAPGEVPRVRVQVQPGLQSRVVQADVQIEGVLAEAAAAGDAAARSTVQAWRDAWAMPAGTFFNDPLWRAAKASALSRLRGAGYASANWSGTSAQVDADQATVRVVVV